MDNQELDFVRKIKDSEIAKRLIKYAKPCFSYFAASILILMVTVPLSLYNPLLIKNIQNNLISTDISYSYILMNIFGMIAILAVNAVGIFFMNYLLQLAGLKVNLQIREKVFTHIEKFSINQFNLTPVGKFVTRVTNDVDSITNLYSSLIIGFLKNGFTAVVALIYMFSINWELALKGIYCIPLLILATIFFRKFTRKAYRDSRTYNTDVNSFLSEHLSGVKITQIFNKEESEISKFKEKTN